MLSLYPTADRIKAFEISSTTLERLATMPPELLDRLLYIGRIIQLAEKSSEVAKSEKAH